MSWIDPKSTKKHTYQGVKFETFEETSTSGRTYWRAWAQGIGSLASSERSREEALATARTIIAKRPTLAAEQRASALRATCSAFFSWKTVRAMKAMQLAGGEDAKLVEFRVPAHPTTTYGNTTPEEGFCEALKLYVNYGPRFLDAETTALLRRILEPHGLRRNPELLPSLGG